MDYAPKKKVEQRPVEVSVAEQVDDLVPSNSEAIVICKNGDAGLKVLHFGRGDGATSYRSDLSSFCREAPGEQVLVITRGLFDDIVAGRTCIHDSDDH